MTWGIVAGAAIGVGGSLLAGSMASDAAGNAADQQRAAADAATGEQRRQYDQTREDFAPYREAGRNALGRIQGLMADPSGITQDPGYQFGLGQGQAAIDRSASSRGGLYSGATLKALQRYGQDYGGTKLNESYNRLASLAGIGQQATGQTAGFGANAVNQIGQNALGVGNTQAAATLAQGNAWGNAMNGSLSALGRVNWGGMGGGGGGGGTSYGGAGGLSQDWWNSGGDY